MVGGVVIPELVWLESAEANDVADNPSVTQSTTPVIIASIFRFLIRLFEFIVNKFGIHLIKNCDTLFTNIVN